MCGIAGFIGQGEKKDLEQMVSAIKYRGPDDKGLFHKKTVALAHARLSILDLSPAGHQPMFNTDNTIGVVFNGEIYNYPALKIELEAKGYVFKSTSDTESIIYLYQEYGEACFEKMNGMFAIAIYDFKQEKLVLGRDRMGKKPLYWSKIKDTLIFGSELKALLAHPLCLPELDILSVNKYLLYEYVPTPHTIFKNIYKLEPGTLLSWHRGDITKRTFWQLDCREKDLPFVEASKRLDTLLEEATKDRLLSDVPLGVLLSGGLDSSAVAYYAQKHSEKKIKTFSIGFTEKSFDESSYARQVASFLGTEHTEYIVSAHDVLQAVSKTLCLLDEPMADPSLVPTYVLAGLTKEKVTVALGGDGGDELFAGYQMFQAEWLARVYRHIPFWIRDKVIANLVALLPVSYGHLGLAFKAKQFIAGFGKEGDHYRHQRWLASFNREDREKLFIPSVWQEVSQQNEYEDIDGYTRSIPGKGLNQLLGIYQRMYMMDGVMVKVDRASMYHSLETRAPLLDYRVVEFANSLPYKYKFKRGIGKYILKKTMEGKLPDQIIYRPKKGFGMPIASWFCGELRPLLEKILSVERINHGGLFNSDYIETLKREHFGGKANHYKKLWTLLVFEIWRDNYLK